MVKGVFYTILSFIALVSPTISLFILNYDVWVVSGESTKISIGVMIGMLYTILIMRGALKEVSPKIATLFSMFVFLAVVWFLESIISDLFWVIFSTIIGYSLYIIVSSIGNRNLTEYKSFRDEKVRIKVRQEAKEEISGV
jgi:hypothetical protein